MTAFVVVTDAMREKRNLLRADEPLIRVPKKREEEAEEGRNKKMEIGKWKLQKKKSRGSGDAEPRRKRRKRKREGEASWTAAANGRNVLRAQKQWRRKGSGLPTGPG